MLEDQCVEQAETLREVRAEREEELERPESRVRRNGGEKPSVLTTLAHYVRENAGKDANTTLGGRFPDERRYYET